MIEWKVGDRAICEGNLVTITFAPRQVVGGFAVGIKWHDGKFERTGTVSHFSLYPIEKADQSALPAQPAPDRVPDRSRTHD